MNQSKNTKAPVAGKPIGVHRHRFATLQWELSLLWEGDSNTFLKMKENA
jgi:hypothetical protein